MEPPTYSPTQPSRDQSFNPHIHTTAATHTHKRTRRPAQKLAHGNTTKSEEAINSHKDYIILCSRWYHFFKYKCHPRASETPMNGLQWHVIGSWMKSADSCLCFCLRLHALRSCEELGLWGWGWVQLGNLAAWKHIRVRYGYAGADL